jgi:hypothetical protein
MTGTAVGAQLDGKEMTAGTFQPTGSTGAASFTAGRLGLMAAWTPPSAAAASKR